MNQLLAQPFVQVTLPLMFTFVGAIWVASWAQNKRFDDIHRRLDAIEARLKKIEDKLETFAERITRVEERTSPVRR